MKLLAGKVALITGGSRGIGAAIVRKFAEQGAHVAFTYRSNAESAQVVAQEAALLSEGIKVMGYQSDAASFDQTKTLIDQVLTEFGQIDILINNAGITRDNLLMRMSEDQWDEVIETNLKSLFNFTKNIMRPMLKAKSGSIINITSIVGVSGNPGQSNYAVTHALDEKLKETMISNTALQRFGQAEEIANACLFLASDLSSYITGEVLMVTGGMR